MEKYTKEISREKALSALNSINPDCSYQVWTELFAACVSTRCLTGEDFAFWSSGYSKSPSHNEIIKKWNTFKPEGGINPGTLFYHAKQSGWKYEKNPSDFPFKKELGELPEQSITYIQPTIIENEFARAVWDMCVPADESHGYIKRKKGSIDGVRVYPMDAPDIESTRLTGEKLRQRVQGWLAVPCWLNGKLQSVQFTHPDNPKEKKPMLNTTHKNGGWFTVGSNSEKIYIVEGIGHAWTINQLTGFMAIHCFGSSELEKVAPSLRSKYPSSELIVVADVGMESKCESIAKKINGSVLKLPEGLENNDDINDYFMVNGKDATIDVINSIKKIDIQEIRKESTRFDFIPAKNLLESPPMDWLLKGVFPTESVISIFGESGAGKTFLALDFAFAVACGYDFWFGMRVKKCPVLYFALEGQNGVNNRIKAWKKYHETKIFPDNFFVMKEAFSILSDECDLIVSKIFDQNLCGSLLIIDTFICSISGSDENNSKDMSLALSAARKIVDKTKCTVLFVHHTGKDTSVGPRGHSSFRGNSDGIIEVKYSDGARSMSIYKSKDGVTGKDFWFDLKTVPLGVDIEGDAVTSCVVVNATRDEFKKPSVDELTPKQNEALEILRGMWISAKHKGKGNAPDSFPCVPLDHFESRLREVLSKSQFSRDFKNMTEVLKKQKLLDFDKSWVWPIEWSRSSKLEDRHD